MSTMITMQSVRRGWIRSFGLAAAAMVLVSAAPPARAMSLLGPAGAPASKQAAAALLTQVRGPHGGGGGGGRGGGFHGGGGSHGGGFRGGGFRGGGFHGGGFHGGGFHRGGFVGRPAFAGGGFHRGGAVIARHRFTGGAPYFAYRRHHFHSRFYGYAAPYYYGPGYYYGHRRFCRVVWTHYGPRRICRFRPWHRHWHHRYHRRFYRYW
jgi:hypothetical protein